MQFGLLSELDQVLGQLAVVPGVHRGEGFGTDQPLDLAHHVQGLRGMRAGRDAETAGVPVEIEQDADRRQRSQIGPDMVDLLNGVQRVTVQRVDADLVELLRP